LLIWLVFAIERQWDTQSSSFYKVYISETFYGTAAGLFYAGYILAEVPSNIYMGRQGIRKTLLRIMVGWGVITAIEAFAKTANQFYLIRFLLGVAEGGFLPAILLYLTYWFPPERKARAYAIFVLVNPFAGIIGGVLSGSIMAQTSGWFGLAGWQNLFLSLGGATVLLGIFAFLYLSDTPASAHWLTKEQRAFIDCEVNRMSSAQTVRERNERSFATDPRTYVAMAIYFMLVAASSTFTMWGPSIIKNVMSGADIKTIGFIAAIPYASAMLGTYVVGKSSDYFQERRWHFLFCALLVCAGFGGIPWTEKVVPLAIALLSIAAIGLYAGVAVFFTIISSFIRKETAPAGIALITAVGSLGGATTPFMVGILRDATGSFNEAVMLVAALNAVGGILMLMVVRDTK
jgi:MFS family permease